MLASGTPEADDALAIRANAKVIRNGLDLAYRLADSKVSEKIAAAIRTAKLRAKRVLAIYQPHGYGPTRFLRRDFVTTFARELGPEFADVDLRSLHPRTFVQKHLLEGDLFDDEPSRGPHV